LQANPAILVAQQPLAPASGAPRHRPRDRVLDCCPDKSIPEVISRDCGVAALDLLAERTDFNSNVVYRRWLF
jgi:hypothetical protein